MINQLRTRKQWIGTVMTLLLFVWQTGQPLQAAILYWDAGGGATTTWTTLANWNTAADGSGVDPAAAPGASDTAVFNVSTLNSAQTATLAAALSIKGFVFNNTGTTKINTDGVANRAVTLGSDGITINAGAGAVTFGTTTNLQRVTFTLGAAQTWLNNSSNAFSLNANNTVATGGFLLTVDGTGTTTAGGVISGTGGIVKNGSGLLNLNAANTFTTGGVTLNAGTLRLGNNAALGGTASVLTITGGTVDVSAARLTTNNNAQNWNGDFTFLGTNTWDTGTGNIVMNANRSVTVTASTMTVGGNISGAGFGLTKLGAGTLVLSGNNGYTGGTTVKGGILQVAGSNASAGVTTITGGTLSLSGNGTLLSTSGVAISNRGTLTLDNSATNLADRVANAAGITSSGGTINFIGNAAATAETLGALTLNAGALTINSTAGAGGSTLTLASIPTRAAGGMVHVSGTGLGGGTNQVLLTTAPALTNSLLKYAVVNNGTVTRFATHGGDGTSLAPLTTGYQAAETAWTGATINALPTADVVLTANRTAYTLTLDDTIDWNISSADRSLTMSGAVLQTGGTSVIGTASGTIDNILAWGANEAIFHVLGTLQLNRGNTNTLTGTAGLTKSGAGTLILNGVSTLTIATPGSAVNINEGILELRGATALLPASSATPVNMNGAMLRLSNDSNTVYNAPLVINADTTIEVSRVTAGATATTHTVGPLTIGGGTLLSVTPNTTQISGGTTAYGLTTGALTLTSDGAVFNVANNGTGTGTLTVGTISGAFTFVKAGAGDLVTNSTASGFTTAVDIATGRVGWANASGTITESQTFSGVGGIIKSGAGTVNLTSNNTFTGGVTVTAGVLQFSTLSDIGGPASNLGQGTISLSGGTLSFIGSTSQSTNRAFSWASGSTGTLNNSGSGGATLTLTGAMTPGALVLSGADVSNVATISGGITQTGTTDDVTITSGTWNFSGTTKTIADDVIVNGTAVLNLNSTGVITGLSGSSNGLYSRNTATINLNADDGYSTSTGLDFILIGDNAAGSPVLNTNTFNITTPRLDVGQDSSGFVGSVTGSGSVTVGTSAHLFQGTLASTASLLGAGSVYKLGGGTFTLSGVLSGMTSVTGPEIHSGVLELDYTTNTAAKFAANTSLNFSGGTLLITGNASADTMVTLAGLNLTTGSSTGNFPTLTGGSSVINLTPGASKNVALSFGSIFHALGGSTIRFNLPSGTQSATHGFVTTQANTNGIIGGYATVFDGTSTNFATNAGGNIVPITPTSQDNVALWATAQNISDSSGFTGTLAANTSITSLRFDAAAASTVTIASGVILNLSSGGVLQTSNVGGVSTIAGGRLQSGAGSELIFNVDSATQRLDVTSQITGAASVTKGGAGTLRLNSANNFYTGKTSVLGGTLEVGGGNAIGDHSDVVVGGGQTSTFKLLADEVIGNLTLGGENGSTAGIGVVSSIDLGSSKLTFNQETAITMVGVLFTSGTGGTLVKSGSASWTNAAANPNFTGTFQVDQGLAIFNGNVNNLSAAAAIVLSGAGSSLRLDNDQTTAVSSRITDTASVTLNNTAGVVADALGLYMRRTNGTTTGTETLGQLILNAGHNTIAAEGNAANRIATINFTNATPLVRNNFSTLFVVGRSLGDTTATQRGNVNFGTNPGGSIGGGGAAGTTTITIFPYVIGESTSGGPNGSVNFGNSFVRYAGTGAPNGFRPLTTGEYINDSAAPATGTNNVRYTATNSITTPAAINSLVLDSGTAIALTGTATSMEITSGAMLAAGVGAHSIGGITSITTGSSGINPYYVYVTNPAGSLTLSSALTSATQLVKSGAGSLTLGSTGNLFTDLYFNQGVVQADAQNKLGVGELKFFGGTLQFNAAFDASTQASGGAKTITLGTGGGTFDTGSFAITLANTIGNNGAGGLTKTGTGSLTLSAPAAYSGGTVIQNGSVILGSGGNNRLPTTTALSLGAGATAGVLQMGNGAGASDQTVSELSVSGSAGAGNKIIGGDSAVSVLTVNQTTQTDFSGSIGGLGTNENNIGITKSGVGSLTLSGSTLTFAGPLSVTAGDLNITGSTGAALTPSALTVNAGATLNLLNGVGQTIDLGAGALNLGAGSGPAILGLELGSTSAYDHVITTGIATTFGSVLINLTNLAGFGAGNYDLLKADGGGLSGATYTLGAAALGGVSLNLVPSDTLVQLQVSAIVGDLYWKGAVGAGWTAFSGASSNFTTDLAGTNNAFGIPGTNNGVIFTANGQTNTALNTTLNTNFFIRDLTFNNNLGSGPLSSISIAEGSGGSLTITPTATTAGIQMEAGSVGNVTITAPVILGASQTWTVADAGSVLSVSGGITGTANLVKSGSGVLAISGVNSYVGTTTVSAGVLRAGSTNAFNSNSAFTIGATGTLRLNGFAQTVISLTGAAGSVLENGAASGNVVLTVGDSSGTTFAGTIQNGAAATLGLTKVGNGPLTLSGNNTYTGNTTVSAGNLFITGTQTGSSTTSAGSAFVLGGTAGTSVLNLSGTISSYLQFSGATVGGANAVYNQTAGTASFTSTSTTVSSFLSNHASGFGALNITGGTTNVLGRFILARNGAATAYVGGSGRLNINGEWGMIVYTNAGALGSLTIGPGGTVDRTGASSNFGVFMEQANQYGVFNLAGGTFITTNRAVVFGNGNGGINNTGFLNLAGGTFSTGANVAQNGGTSTGQNAYINLAGGTLRATANLSNVFPATVAAQTVTVTNFGAIDNIGTAQDFTGGLTVDTNGNSVTIQNPVVAATGEGVAQSSLTVAGGSGYVGAPLVQFVGGTLAPGGTPAAGYAIISGGQVSEIVITSPGTYTTAPTVVLTGGGGTGASVTVGTLVANTSGGLAKIGAGTLTLSGSNTYTGGTTISNGTLALGASNVLADTGNLTVNGGIFSVGTFNDTVATVSLQSGSITGTTGVLTSTSDFDLRSGMVDFSGTGGLAGSVNVTKSTAGVVVLANNGLGGTFANAVNINGGVLEFTSSSQLGSGGAGNTVSINGATLRFNSPTSTTISRAVSIGTSGATLDTSFALGVLQLGAGITTAAAGNLTKLGAGTVTVSNTTNLSGGNVTVSGGTLNAGFSASGISGITVAGGATLNLYDSAAVTTAITSLNLAGGSALGFDLNAPGTNDVLALTSNAPALAGSITVNLSDLGSLGVGTYDLITSALGGLGGATFVLGTAPSGPNYSFASVSGNTILRLTVSALTLRYWQGDQDGSWTTNNGVNTNWALDEDGNNNASSLPSATDTLVFSTTNAPFTSTSPNIITTTLDGSRTADSLRFLPAPSGVTAFQINPGSGGTLTLNPVSSNNGISVADNAGAVTISADLATGAMQTWEVVGTGANGSSLTISGAVTFNHSVTKTGVGVLTLNGTAANTGAGGLTVTAGTLNLGKGTAPGTGTLIFGPGIVLDNTSGSSLTLTNNNAVVVNGSFSFTGTNDLNLGTGAFTLGANAILQIVNNQLIVGGIIGDGGSNWGLGKAGAGVLVLNGNNTYDGVTSLLQGTLTLAGNNSAAGGGVTTSTGTTLNINNNNALGTGTLTLASGSTIDNTAGSPVANAGGNLQVWNGNFTFTGTNSLDLGSGAITLGASLGITTSGVATTLTVGGVIDDGVNTFSLTKDGAGTLVLSGLSSVAANNYSGTTILNGGGATISTSASLAGGLTFGAGTGSTTAATLNITNGATFAGVLLVQNRTSTANSISISSGQTLTLNGNFTVGAADPGAVGATSGLTLNGGGNFNMSTPGGTFQVGGSTSAANSLNSIVDMKGLNSAVINLGTTGTLRVNQPNANNANGNSASLLLPTPTVALNTVVTTITANNFNVGDNGGNNALAGQTNSVTLGTGLTTLNVNTVNVGSGARDFGEILYAAGNGTLRLRAADGVGRATVNIGTGTANTGVAAGTGVTNNINLNGHGADLLISTLTIGGQNRNTNRTDTFSFNTGTLDVTTVVVGDNNGTANTTAGSHTWTSTLNIGGGTTTIGSGGLEIARGDTAVTGTDVLVGTVNISGGAVTINNSTGLGTAVRLGNNTIATGLTTDGMLNITGGTVTLGGNIIRGATVGPSSATITLDGGTLDMGGNTIGSAVNLITFNVQSGTLKNLFRFNGGGTLTKTTAGTLILEGTNSYAGTTVISGGVLQVGSGSATGTLGTGGVTNNATLTFNRGNSYIVSNAISGTGQVIQAGSGTTVLTNANTYSGTTTISAGTLQLGDGTSGNDGTIGGSASIVNDGALVYNRFGTSSYGGVISGTGTVTKTGAGTQVLSSANTYSGGTVVLAGVLEVNNTTGSGTGSGNVTVGSGAKLAGSGSIAGGTILGSGTILAPGEGNTASSNKTLTFTSVTAANTAQIQLGVTSADSVDASFATWFQANPGGTAAGYLATLSGGIAGTTWNNSPTGDHDSIAASGSLTLGESVTSDARISVSLNGLTSVTYGSIFNLLDWSTASTKDQDSLSSMSSGTFSLTNLQLEAFSGALSGFAWDTSIFNSYGILVVVPEPSRGLLIMFGLWGLVMRRRRCRP